MFGYEEELQDKLQDAIKRITKLEQAPDAQTIMFWTLQLQFLSMSLYDVRMIRYHSSLPLFTKEKVMSHEELATDLALHLSGLK